MFKGKFSGETNIPEIKNNEQSSNPKSPGDGHDLREAIRRRVLKTGNVTYNSRSFTSECVIRDISSNGAKLKTLGSVDLPDHFELSSELDGFIVECEVTWRNGNELGVRFTSPMQSIGVKRVQVVQNSTPPKKPLALRRSSGNS